MLLDVSPYFPANDLPDKRRVHAELKGDGFISLAQSVPLSNQPHIHFGQLGTAISVSLWRRFSPAQGWLWLPAFAVPVAHIVGMRAKPKVARVAAPGVIATVANVEVAGTGASGEGKCDAMSLESSSVPIPVSVTERRSCANPRPTIVMSSSIHFGPKRGHLIGGKVIEGKMKVRHFDLPSRSRWRRARGVAALPGFSLPQFYQIRGTY